MLLNVLYFKTRKYCLYVATVKNYKNSEKKSRNETVFNIIQISHILNTMKF
jgi:hypothetical protein